MPKKRRYQPNEEGLADAIVDIIRGDEDPLVSILSFAGTVMRNKREMRERAHGAADVARQKARGQARKRKRKTEPDTPPPEDDNVIDVEWKESE